MYLLNRLVTTLVLAGSSICHNTLVKRGKNHFAICFERKIAIYLKEKTKAILKKYLMTS